MNLRQAISEVQRIGKEHDFTVAIVGGAFVRLISHETAIQKIDTKHRIITLSHAENPGTTRKTSKTTIDIDALAFYTGKDAFSKEVRTKFAKLKDALNILASQDGFPPISLEPVFYHPPFPKPNSLLQFVSSIEQEREDSTHFLFRLGEVSQKVRKESLDIWTVELVETKDKVQTLSPLAIQLRYSVRGFSRKPKDIEKIWGEKSAFAKLVKDFQEKTNHQYDTLYQEWYTFEKNVQTSKEPLMLIKRTFWKVYWNTIGTYLAHGTGLIGKLLLPLGNTLFAGK